MKPPPIPRSHGRYKASRRIGTLFGIFVIKTKNKQLHYLFMTTMYDTRTMIVAIINLSMNNEE